MPKVRVRKRNGRWRVQHHALGLVWLQVRSYDDWRQAFDFAYLYEGSNRADLSIPPISIPYIPPLRTLPMPKKTITIAIKKTYIGYRANCDGCRYISNQHADKRQAIRAGEIHAKKHPEATVVFIGDK